MMKNQILRVATLLPLFHLGGAQLPDSCASAGCLNTIGGSQDCLRQCTNEAPNPAGGGDTSASLLWQCLSSGRTITYDSSSVMGDLIGCCGMDSYNDANFGGADCRATMGNAKTCATTQGCIDPCVKQTAIEYLQCIQGAKVSGTCPWAAFCMGTLFNDPQLAADGTPLLGTNSLDFADILANAAGSSISASSCVGFDPFVNKVCQLGGSCCDACNVKLASLTNCLVNNFVLPLYKVEKGLTSNTLTCPVSESRCKEVTTTSRSGGRFLAEESTNSSEFTVNITECETDMSFNWIAHNESYAAGEFFNCIGTQMVQIIATEDEDTAGASSAWRMASLGVSSMAAVAVASFL